jgi:tryptophan synthase alpha chain
MVLDLYLRKRLDENDILLMTHIVLGYPSFEDNLRIIETMVAAGVDLMELQIPFSRPTADGPVIARANQKALKGGATVKDCLNLAETAARNFDIPFLLMSYYSIPFRYGVDRFVTALSHGGVAWRPARCHHTGSASGRRARISGCHACAQPCPHPHLFTNDLS